MKRGQVLNVVLDQCRQQGVHGGIGELLIQGHPGFPGAKRRSVFVAETDQAELERLTTQCGQRLTLFPEYEVVGIWHGTVDEPQLSDRVPLTSNKLENNWRCRLIRPNQIDFNSVDQFERLIMRSTWRIVVSRRGAEYFTRRDIYPLIWHPGSSVAGMAAFQGSVRSELEALADQAASFVDEYNDIIKCFANKDGGRFNDLVANGVGIDELRDDFEGIFDRFIGALNQYWAAP